MSTNEILLINRQAKLIDSVMLENDALRAELSNLHKQYELMLNSRNRHKEKNEYLQRELSRLSNFK